MKVNTKAVHEHLIVSVQQADRTWRHTLLSLVSVAVVAEGEDEGELIQQAKRRMQEAEARGAVEKFERTVEQHPKQEPAGGAQREPAKPGA